MKILITSMFYAKSYGQGLCVQKLAEFLSAKGHKVMVFHGEKKEIKGRKNLEIKKIPSVGIKGIDLLAFSLNLKKKALQEKDFDVIYPQDYSFGLADFKKLGIPVVFHARGTVKGNSLNRPKTGFKTEFLRKAAIPLMVQLDKNCCENSQTIIAASGSIEKEIKGFYGISGKKIKIVSDGVDLKKFSSSTELKKKAQKLRKKLGLKKNKILLFAGRLVPQKGLLFLVKALPEIMRKIPETVLLIAGENTSENHKKEIEKEILKLGIKNKIKFLGYVEQEKMPELIELSDVIVSPSTYEPIGIINLEAIALNKPVIIPKSIGSINLLKDSAVTVNPENPQEISSAVIKLFSSKKLYNKLAKKGRLNAKKADWNRIGKKIESILEIASKKGKKTVKAVKAK
ncbi:MAG: glycosyltransferase family 4 protein [archaeon]